MTSSLPRFGEVFHALWDCGPFPWQERLAEQVLDSGWPELLDLPTGVGKTSALDIALYCLAASPERMPRRTLLIVDRRVVVDQGAERARRILARLREGGAQPLSWLSNRLRGLWNAGPQNDPFAVAVMRGGMPRDNDWARRPDQPVLGVSTVDQVGSRLLFRGYGLGARSAPIHAGLLGQDTLLLLDEVHLAVPFMKTLTSIRKHYVSTSSGIPGRFEVVRMSATPGERDKSWRVFELAAADREHEVLAKRLQASKPARLLPLRVTGDDTAKKRELLAEKLATEARTLREQGARVVAVVVNRVDTARLVYQRLVGEVATEQVPTSAILVTGRMRPLERDRLVQRELLVRAGPRQERPEDSLPLYVVSTQCIEAGADLDFDALVTECASLDALRQRFGRLDRQGLLGHAPAVILGMSDAVTPGADDPIYGTALAATWAYLSQHATADVIDFGIEAMNGLVSSDDIHQFGLIPPSPQTPVLLPTHLDSWAQTEPAPATEPDISLWLHGVTRASADVQLVWRSELELPLSADNSWALENVVHQLQARRPSALEAISVPLLAARAWLARGTVVPIADVTAADVEADAERAPLDQANIPCGLRWAGDRSRFVTSSELRPGDVLVLPCARGGLLAGSFDPDAEAEVSDLGDLAQLRARGTASLRLTQPALAPWGLDPAIVDAAPRPNEDESVRETRERLASWISTWPVTSCTDLCTEREWSLLRSTLSAAKARVVQFEVGQPRESILLGTAKVPSRLLQTDVEESLTEDDDSSFRQAEVTLAAHSGDVQANAAAYAQALGLSPMLSCSLSVAGWLHDVGKADERFQRWLVGGSEIRALMLAEPLAKSALPVGSQVERERARQRAGYPAGYRHELLSLAMIEGIASLGDDIDRELVLHLVAAHHGYCRPFPPALDDPDDLQVTLTHGSSTLKATTRHQLARLDRGVGERFWKLVRRYGWWGLAWLEAILRLADHRASEDAAEEKS